MSDERHAGPESGYQATDLEEDALASLGPRFLQALGLKEAGRVDDAEEALVAILKEEPRLPEPRMELARIHLDTERIDTAEEHARTALEHLESGGQWTDMLPEEVLLSVAHALLAEILRRRLEEDAVIFGDPAEFKALLAESKTHFARARELDPTDETSSYYAFFLGPEGHGSKDEGGAAAQPTSDEPFEN